MELARAAKAAKALAAAIAHPAGTLETRASELARASNNTALPPDDIENALAQAAKVEAALRLAVSGSNA